MVVVWILFVTVTLAGLVFAPVLIAVMMTGALATAWCIAIDREEYRIQVVGSDVLNL